MAIEKKLIHFSRLSDFETQLNAGNILDYSIVFIQDAKKIWTHSQYYDCNGGSSIDLSEYLTADEIAEIYATIESLEEKQDALVSGTNIKTINGESLLGSGDITISPQTPMVYQAATSAATGIPMNTVTVVTTVSTTSKTFVIDTTNAVTKPADLSTEQKWSLIFGISASLSSAPTITFSVRNFNILWANGVAPTFEVGKCYEVSFLNIGGTLLGVCGTFSAAS